MQVLQQVLYDLSNCTITKNASDLLTAGALSSLHACLRSI